MFENQASQLRIGVVTIALAASGVVLLLLPFFALGWAAQPFPGFLLDPHLVVNDTNQPHWAGQQVIPPIAYPERVTAVEETAVDTPTQFWQQLAVRGHGETITLTLVQPQSSRISPRYTPSERTVTVTLGAFSAGDLWNQFWLFYLAGLFTWGIGAWTFWVRPREEAAQIFALFTTLAALSVALLFDQLTTQHLIGLWIVALSLVGAFGVWLTAIFPHETRLIRQWAWLKWVILLPGAATAVWSLLWLNHADDPWAYAIPWRAAFLLNGAALVTMLAMMVYRGYWSRSALVRQQGRLILVGCMLAFAPILLFFLTAALGIHLPWLPATLYVPPVVIFPFAIGYTIVRYRLLDTSSVLVRRGVTYVVMTGLLLVVFVLVLTGVTASFGSMVEGPWLLVLFFALVAFLFDPIRSRLQAGIDQVFFREPVVFDDLLREYHRDLTKSVHMNDVAAVLMAYVGRGVPQANAQLFLPDQVTNGYSSFVNHSDVMVNHDSPLVEFMRQQSGPIDLEEERAWPDTFLRHREEVRALQADVVVPINNGDDLLGWLAVASKQGNGRFSTSELNYLNALSEQSVIAMERATVVRRLESRIDELDQLSQFSQWLSITLELEDLLELVVTQYQRLLKVDDFFVALRDPETEQIYNVFALVDGERRSELEGRERPVQRQPVLDGVHSGQQQVWRDENGRSWIATPLNAGPRPLGAVYANYHDAVLSFSAQQQRLFDAFADRTAVALERLNTNDTLEDRARQLEIINDVTSSLASTLALDALLELILAKAMELLRTEAGTFMLMTEDTGELEFCVVKGPASQDLLGTRLPIGKGLAGTAAKTGQPLLVNGVQSDERWFSQVDDSTTFESHSILTAPLMRHNNVLGVLQVINKLNGLPFNEQDQQMLMLFAGQAVVALENARLLSQTDEALRKSVDELSMLQQMDRELNATLDLKNVLTITLERLLGVCQGTAGAIVLVDVEKRPYQFIQRGYDDEFVAEAKDLGTLNRGLVGQVIRSGKPKMTPNVHEATGYVAASFTTHSQLTIPLVSQQKLIGVAALERDVLDGFDPHVVETVVRLTNHAAAAIANAVLYEQVNEANQAKSEFVSMVSHELKTPMTAIRGYVDLMLSGMTGDLTAQQHNFLETIAANVRRMGQQIQDLTDISRIEMNRLHMEMSPTTLESVMNETLQTVQALCDEKQISLNLDLPASLPRVLADRSRLVQVMTNLVSNACKYSPAETAVTVRCRPHEEDGRLMVLCAVIDQGYGISEEDQKQLFTKFFRSDDPNIRQSKGTGLGLSITRGIVELHGGRIWVESERGKGTTFTFTIPRYTPD